MSYNVAIGLPPFASGDEAAWQDLDGLIDEQGAVPGVFQDLISRLTERYPCLSDLPDDQVDDGVWSDGPLRNNAGYKVTVLGLSYSRVDEVLPFLIETANDLGLSVYDWATGRIHRGNGIRGLTMRVEGEMDFRNPTREQVLSAVDRLTPHGGPGFLILEGPDQDYSQVAGGDGVYCAEWREYSGDLFHHWVAGRRDSLSTAEVTVPTNGFHVTVRGNERLTLQEVKTILTAFAAGTGRPVDFSWRDNTDMFT